MLKTNSSVFQWVLYKPPPNKTPSPISVLPLKCQKIYKPPGAYILDIVIIPINKPGFHTVVSVVSAISVLSKKFLRQIQLYGNLTHNCPVQQIRQIQRVVRDRTDSISYDRYNRKWAWHDSILLMETTTNNSYDRYNKNMSQNTLMEYNTETQDTQLSYELHRVVFALQGASFTRQKRQLQLYGNQALGSWLMYLFRLWTFVNWSCLCLKTVLKTKIHRLNDNEIRRI